MGYNLTFHYLFCCSNCSSFGQRELFSVCLLTYLNLCICLCIFEHVLISQYYKMLQPHLGYSKLQPQNQQGTLLPVIEKIVLETKIWVLGILIVTRAYISFCSLIRGIGIIWQKIIPPIFLKNQQTTYSMKCLFHKIIRAAYGVTKIIQARRKENSIVKHCFILHCFFFRKFYRIHASLWKNPIYASIMTIRCPHRIWSRIQINPQTVKFQSIYDLHRVFY